jgi:hypothetical protein
VLLDMGELREIVWARSLGVCEHSECGERLSAQRWECHHRKLRAQGGHDCACNLLALHPRCHVQGRTAVHDYPTYSYAAGLLVKSWQQSDLVPVALPGRAAVLLTCGGTYS